MTSKQKAHIGILLANLFFAINISAVKHLTTNDFIQPFAINLLRAGVSAFLFWSLLFFSPDKKYLIKKQHWGKFVLCALCGISLNQTFFIKGLSLTLPTHAALLLLITPILISLAAVYILKEKLSIYKILGLTLGITGAVILITAKKCLALNLDYHKKNFEKKILDKTNFEENEFEIIKGLKNILMSTSGFLYDKIKNNQIQDYLDRYLK